MQRVFLKDAGRFKAGDVADYPLGTWKRFFPNFLKITQDAAEALSASVAAQQGKEARYGRAKA